MLEKLSNGQQTKLADIVKKAIDLQREEPENNTSGLEGTEEEKISKK